MRKLLDSSWQEVKRLFALANNNKKGNNQDSIDSIIEKIVHAVFNINLFNLLLLLLSLLLLLLLLLFFFTLY